MLNTTDWVPAGGQLQSGASKEQQQTITCNNVFSMTWPSYLDSRSPVITSSSSSTGPSSVRRLEADRSGTCAVYPAGLIAFHPRTQGEKWNEPAARAATSVKEYNNINNRTTTTTSQKREVGRERKKSWIKEENQKKNKSKTTNDNNNNYHYNNNNNNRCRDYPVGQFARHDVFCPLISNRAAIAWMAAIYPYRTWAALAAGAGSDGSGWAIFSFRRVRISNGIYGRPWKMRNMTQQVPITRLTGTGSSAS